MWIIWQLCQLTQMDQPGEVFFRFIFYLSTNPVIEAEFKLEQLTNNNWLHNYIHGPKIKFIVHWNGNLVTEILAFPINSQHHK